MGKINILTEETINKIAAGEVVERPASVVKELVENAIDAGADSVEIAVEGAGQSLVRVADNGQGMTAEDAEISCQRHATSKITSIDDLDRVRTLGFRGEALASIAAVSQMDLTTSDGGGTGVYLYLESGQVQKKRPAGRARGTTVEVRNLFYNVPARRKFLKKEATEFAEIVNVVTRFIVAHPDVEFKLMHGDKRVLHADRGMGLGERISLVLGGEIFRNMVSVSLEREGCAVTGFVTRPSITRKDRRSQMFFVNGRFVRSRLLSDAVYGAYRSLLERGTFPAAALFLEVEPSEMDVNVHPTKMEIKFEDEKAVRENITAAISGAFERLKADQSRVRSAEAPVREGGTEPAEMPVFTGIQELQTEFKYEPGEKTFVRRPLSEEVFQVGKCYIARLKDDAITLTDQHAAHERVLYEFFSRAAANASAEVQRLLFPINIELSAREAAVMEKTAGDLKTLGFHIEPFGERSFVVQAVPSILKDRDIQTVIRDILEDLSLKDLSRIDVIDELVKLASCKAAIKAGDPMSAAEMQDLLGQLSRCELPFTCPHGRPTMIDITVSDLEKLFRRK